jgi:hypothetical protein
MELYILFHLILRNFDGFAVSHFSDLERHAFSASTMSYCRRYTHTAYTVTHSHKRFLAMRIDSASHVFTHSVASDHRHKLLRGSQSAECRREAKCLQSSHAASRYALTIGVRPTRRVPLRLLCRAVDVAALARHLTSLPTTGLTLLGKPGHLRTPDTSSRFPASYSTNPRRLFPIIKTRGR